LLAPAALTGPGTLSLALLLPSLLSLARSVAVLAAIAALRLRIVLFLFFGHRFPPC
jgi:hypothetical protein